MIVIKWIIVFASLLFVEFAEIIEFIDSETVTEKLDYPSCSVGIKLSSVIIENLPMLKLSLGSSTQKLPKPLKLLISVAYPVSCPNRIFILLGPSETADMWHNMSGLKLK